MDKFLIVQNPMAHEKDIYVLAMGRSHPQLFQVVRRECIELEDTDLAEVVEIFFYPKERKKNETWAIRCMDWNTTTRAQDEKTIKRLVRWFTSYRHKYPNGHHVEP